MPNGDGGGFDFGGLFDPLLTFLAALIQAIIAFLIALVQALVQVLNFLFEGEQGIFGFSNKGLGEVFKSIKGVLDQVFKVWVVKALQHLLSLYQKLQAWIKKLRAWLDRLRKLQQVYQVQALRRFINLIQRIRKFLVIFRILHLKFATKLDHWLAGIEGKLISNLSKYAAKTNEIIGVINLILDPLVLFDGRLHLGSSSRGLGQFRSILAAFGLKDFTPWLAPQLGPGVAVRKWSEVYTQFLMESSDNSGATGAASRQFAQYEALFARDIGGGGA